MTNNNDPPRGKSTRVFTVTPPQSSSPVTPPPSVSRIPRGIRRSGAHTPRTLAQVMREADEDVQRGNLTDFVPIPTGFDPLDGYIGGGLRKTELMLVGGSQGIGKTILGLQMARNIASRPDQYAFYVSYEHPEAHLMHRLLCLESINLPDVNTQNGLRLKDLHDIIISQRAMETVHGHPGDESSLQAILRDNPRTANLMNKFTRYADRLIVVKASPSATTIGTLREMVARLVEATGGNLTVFIDYLQKVEIHPEVARDENDKVTVIVEGLKDIALTNNVPVVAIVAADREGLKSKRMHLFHLRGSSALDYECDIAVILNEKYHILAKDHVTFNPYQAKQYREWVIFTIEKNRAGRAMIDLEFQRHAPFFAFDPRGQQVQQQLIDEKIIES